MSSLPLVTCALLLANFAAQGINFLTGGGLIRPFALWPVGHGFEPWQLVTHAFLHGNWAHLLVNMMGLWVLGGELERLCGPRRLIGLYLGSVLGAAAVQLGAMALTSGPVGVAVGASGGVFGLLLAFGLTFPDDIVMLVVPPIPVRARTLVVLNAGLAVLLGVSGMLPGVAHWAHLGGMLAAWVVIRRWPRPWPSPEADKRQEP